ncbi:flagellar hook-length control protein FliK [Achromobacter deleyi]|uniref:flagellar hook-length control protein FliK n=1 Tax=Achromobacter deleyi TaxID=1353891 RepID=UPI001490A117|nr:flagellar hook-length control protein FliK [Achromobacter deleyi]QVQ28716.1 flagellar hook-length control protein FliK [Achromobacter deleyi]UIP18832.1 flagellar hook-length control protein FliK [Achromobacter deleyi]
MSIGPAALGNVLVQRLDAVLGTTMSAANANQISGARPDAVSQPGSPEKPGPSDGSTRDSRQGIQTGGARGDRQNTVVDPKTAAALALAARGLVTSSDTTASAPTTLGTTARTILALLAQYPETAPAVQGRAPLWSGDASGAQPGGAATGQATAGQPGQAAQPGQPAPAPAPAQPATAANLPPALPTTAAGAGETAAAKPAPHSAGLANGAHGAKGPDATAHASLATGGPSARALGQALRVALQTSGLFYESHLTDMVFGRTNPSTLQNEPQARLAKDAAAQGNAQTRGRPETAGASRSGASADAPSSSGPSGSSAPGAPISGIHQDLTVLVRQQLDVLANQTLTWQGEAWPGTPMEWEVERDPYGADRESAVPTWATRLKLDLPRLGLVDARLNLAGDQIVLQLIAPHSASEINDSSDTLRSRLLAAGLTLSNLSVSVVEPRPVIPADF